MPFDLFTRRSSTTSTESSDLDSKKAGSLEGGEPIVSALTGTTDDAFEVDQHKGLGRHLGLWSTTFLITGRIIGTGIFSTPSSILNAVGSLGAAMMLWLIGTVLAFCGLYVYLEFASMFPRSGGEKVYLEAVYRRPKLLITTLFGINAVVLGFTASGCIVFASNILVAAGHEVTTWNERGIAVAVILSITLIHGLAPRVGVRFMNALAIFKILLLLLVVISGWVVLAGGIKSIPDPKANFRNGFDGTSHSAYFWASGLFKVINSFSGWSNATYVMNEVKRPIRTIRIAGPLGLGLCAVLYIMANISYFAAVNVHDLKASGVTVASYYFRVVFGKAAQRALSVFVALSAYGNVMTVTFAQSRVNQELAKEGLFPYTEFFASNWPCKSPFAGLIVHLIPSLIIILGPPAKIAYPFILDVEGYPGQIIALLVVSGLIYLRWKEPDRKRPIKAFLPAILFYLVVSIFLLVVPFLRPPGGVGDTPPLPYWLYPVVGIAVFVSGFIYWAVWRIVLPKLGKFKWEETQVTLADGTLATKYVRAKNE
ncbi:hypothetical protein JCM3766R1_004617 [Sporobolomyces carnicolor]